jgi:hypothetical protein
MGLVVSLTVVTDDQSIGTVEDDSDADPRST